jgi:septum formation protein
MAEADCTELILASASAARRDLLQAAGLDFRVQPSSVDEPAIRLELQRRPETLTPARVAEQLAFAKARQVSGENRHSLVIGADQVLAVGDGMLSKPRSMAEARDMLLELRGRTHHLYTSVALAASGEVSWTHSETAALTMRQFSPAFLDDYLARCGARACNSPGAYEIESLGIQLFERIEGDYFAILGLPLVPLLGELRARGFLAE